MQHSTQVTKSERRFHSRNSGKHTLQVPNVFTAVIGESLQLRMVDPQPRIFEIGDFTTKRDESGDKLQVIPGNTTKGVGSNQPRNEHTHRNSFLRLGLSLRSGSLGSRWHRSAG